AVALAGFAAPALDVEGEAARLVATLAALGQHGIKLAYRREDSGVGRRIRARRAPDRRLIDLDHLVDGFEPVDPRLRARLGQAAVELARQRAEKNILNQRRFARS